MMDIQEDSNLGLALGEIQEAVEAIHEGIGNWQAVNRKADACDEPNPPLRNDSRCQMMACVADMLGQAITLMELLGKAGRQHPQGGDDGLIAGLKFANKPGHHVPALLDAAKLDMELRVEAHEWLYPCGMAERPNAYNSCYDERVEIIKMKRGMIRQYIDEAVKIGY